MRKIYELRRRNYWYWPAAIGLVFLAALAFLAYDQIPRVHNRVNWEIDKATTYIRLALDPIQPMPAPITNSVGSDSEPGLSDLLLTPPPVMVLPTTTPTPAPPTPTAILSPTPTSTPTITPTPTPLPAKVALPPPPFEKQDLNSCGPATLNHYLRFYGWKGNLADINKVVKPSDSDRNVNVEELVYFARTRAGWLQTEFRVGGSVELAKKFIAAGIPYMIEVGVYFDQGYWPGDDRWGGHYLLLTGYDDALNSFIVHDAWMGPNRIVPYTEIDKNWQAFNRVYIMIFQPDQLATVQSILGSNWDVASNRKNALEQSKAETEKNPKDALAWFNYGTNLIFFDRYIEAAKAYDTSRTLNLPQRMLRYQFGPFISYFHAGRLDDLMSLTEYAMKLTPTSEETMLWRGWGLYRQGNKQQAIDLWKESLKIHPNYDDALYAINFAQKN
jgi:tetratricopeptide (TPR) repeat protein